jgi:hypothetical protein
MIFAVTGASVVFRYLGQLAVPEQTHGVCDRAAIATVHLDPGGKQAPQGAGPDAADNDRIRAHACNRLHGMALAVNVRLVLVA